MALASLTTLLFPPCTRKAKGIFLDYGVYQAELAGNRTLNEFVNSQGFSDRRDQRREALGNFTSASSTAST
jgi:hypothetical protein